MRYKNHTYLSNCRSWASHTHTALVLDLLHNVVSPVVHSPVDPTSCTWFCVHHKPVHTSRRFATEGRGVEGRERGGGKGKERGVGRRGERERGVGRRVRGWVYCTYM